VSPTALALALYIGMRSFMLFTLAVVAAGTIALRVAAAEPPPALAEMVGHWNCVDHDSTGNVTRFKSGNAFYGAWLELNAEYVTPPGLAAHTYLGFDTTRRRWVITAVSNSGGYYVRVSSSGTLSGSRWVDAYPIDGGTAVLTLMPPGRYGFDFAQGTGATAYTAHVVCSRTTQ
jgi:hypothetical protein